MEKVKETIAKIKPVDKELMEKTQKRLDNLTKPKGSLGKLEALAKKVVGITKKETPSLKNKVIFIIAGDHGVVAEGVSAYPQEVTAQMVYNFVEGGAGINILAKYVGARVVIVDMGVKSVLKIQHPAFKSKKIGWGTKNMAKEPAMTYEEAVKSIKSGIALFEEEFEKGIDILGIGDMGIGNTTPSSAIIAAFSSRSVKEVTGRGTGIDEKMWENKIKVIEKALEVNKPNSRDPIDVLSKVGGFEIGGLAGVVLGAVSHQIPVVIDGFISTAGALIATELAPLSSQYIIASHKSREIGHQVMLRRMGLEPLLDLNLRLGEGTGACLGIGLVEAGVRILTEMATFGKAGVSRAAEVK